MLAIFLNTAFIFAEPVLAFVQTFNPVVLFILEGILILGYSINRFLGDFSKAVEITLEICAQPCSRRRHRRNRKPAGRFL